MEKAEMEKKEENNGETSEKKEDKPKFELDLEATGDSEAHKLVRQMHYDFDQNGVLKNTKNGKRQDLMTCRRGI
jgi:hypothetical protein